MCKTIAHLIQSCLLYVPADFQGLITNRTRAAINFLRPFITGNYFFGIEKTFFHAKNADIQDNTPARNILAVSFLELATTVSRN